MAWQIVGEYHTACSCNVGCPCTLGEPDGDRGWCSGTLVFEVTSGNSDGVDLSGTKAFLLGDWPRGFLSGEGKGRLYFDTSVSDEQQKALEPILTGQAGGPLEAMSHLFSQFLPSKKAAISIDKSGDETVAKAEGVGDFKVTSMRGPDGSETRLINAAATFRKEIVLGKGSGSDQLDSDFRQKERYGGHGEWAAFDWKS